MNAVKLLKKYELLAETAHRLGAWECAKKWSIKVEKLEAAIAALEKIEIKEEKLMENSIIITVPSEEFWVWLWSDGIYEAGSLEDYEAAQDKADDDRNIVRSYSELSLDYPKPGVYRFYVKNFRKNGETPVLETL